MNNPKKIGSIIVTFEPNVLRLKQNVDAIIKQVELIVIVDNGSINQNEILKLFDGHSKVYTIFLDCNEGIAFALNKGFAYFNNNSYEWVVTLDQDSVCPENMVFELLKTQYLVEKPGIICPAVLYEGTDIKSKTRGLPIEKINACMTSASLTKVNVWAEVHGYDEGFFIDFVDNDFCKKINLAGYSIYRNNAVVLNHQLGVVNFKTFFGRKISYFHHSPLRYYYMVRNNLVFIKRYKKDLPIFRENLKIIYIMLMGLLFEDKRMLYLKMYYRAIKDARNNKIGKFYQ